MSTRMFRVGLSFIVGLGCWIGKVQAQAPADAPPAATVALPVYDAAPTAERDGGPVRNWLHRGGYCCAQKLDWYGCGGWHAQNTFVFGSCRTFFGEPCLSKSLLQQERGGCGR